MRLLLFILLLFSFGRINAQVKEVVVFATIKDDDSGKKLGGATVEIYKGSELITTSKSPSSGKVPPLYIETGGVYRIYVKKEGYVTKMAEVNTNVSYPEDADNLSINFVVSIFERVDHVDFSYLESTPMTKFSFADDYLQTYDKAYTEEMLRKIEELKRKIEEQKKEETKEDIAKKEMEADFQAYVDAGDAFMTSKKYQAAADQYNLALGLKKDDQLVVTKRDNALKLLQAEKDAAERERKFNEKMLEASKAFKAENWTDALKLYKEAELIDKSKPEPGVKITVINDILKKLKENEAKVKELIKKGDVSMTSKSYDLAIINYSEALEYDAKNEEAITKLADAKAKKLEAENLAESEKQKTAQYEALMKSGQAFLDQKKYNEAIEKFTSAKDLKPLETAPPVKIKEADDLLKALEAQQRLEEDYKAKMAEADNALGLKDYNNALVLYQEAHSFIEKEQKPLDQIELIKGILEKSNETQAKFDKLVKEGDANSTSKEFENAISKYEEAIALKPESKNEVQPKIDKAKASIAALKAESDKLAKLEQDYKTYVDLANAARDNKNYTDAITNYNAALKLKENEIYPKSEIEKINKILKDLEDEKNRLAKEETAYKALIAEANALFDKESWDLAKAKYEIASNQKNEDPFPKSRIELINSNLSAMAVAAANEKAYQEQIKLGKAAFESKKYQDAINAYKKAKELKSEETLPDVEINKINLILKEIKAKEELEANYKAAIEKANSKRDESKLTEAIIEYENALKFKENDSYALNEIKLINDKLNSLKSEKELEEKFKALELAGDKLITSKDLQAGINKYKEAISIKESTSISAKISKAELALKALKEKETKAKDFANLLNEAETLYTEKKLDEALSKYKELEVLDNTDIEIKNKIKAINSELLSLKNDEKELETYNALIEKAKEFEKLTDYEKALNTYKEAYNLRDEPETKEFINRVNKKIEEAKLVENSALAYENKIAEADQKFKENKWTEAIAVYNEAKRLDGTKPYPDSQIKLCNNKVEEAKKLSQTAEYDEYIRNAEASYANNKLDDAIVDFEKALKVFPKKTYPLEKIEEINDKIAKNKYQLDNQAANEKKFNGLVSEGDEFYDKQEYELALEKYEAAKIVKSEDPTLITKITQTQKNINALTDAKKLAIQYEEQIKIANELMKNGDWENAIDAYQLAKKFDPINPYTNKQIVLAKTEIEKSKVALTDKAFDELMAKAQGDYDNQNFEQALVLYKRAFMQRNSSTLASGRISEINQILNRQKQQVASVNEFDKLMIEAEKLFEAKKWKEARAIYVKAYAIENDPRADSQIKKIDAINDKFSREQYKKMIDKADEYFRDENYNKAKGLYLRAIKTFASQDQNYPKAQIKRINNLLNPPEIVKNNNVKPVGNKTNLTEQEMQQKLIDAEKQRKENNTNEVLNSQSESNSLEGQWLESEEQAINRARDTIAVQIARIYEKDQEAKTKLDQSTSTFEEISEKRKEINLEQQTYADNVVYRQSQIGENIETETYEYYSNSDQKRIETEEKITEIDQDFSTQSIDFTSSQTNMLFVQEDKIDKMNSEIYNSNKNSNIETENTSLDIENIAVDIDNKSNKRAWDNVDDIHNTSNYINNAKDEQYSAAEYSDLPRQKMENTVTTFNEDLKTDREGDSKIADNSMHKTENSITDLKSKIVSHNENADLERQAQEFKLEEINKLIQEANSSVMTDSENQTFTTNKELKEMILEQQKVNDNQDDKHFEDIETINKTNSELDLIQTEQSEGASNVVNQNLEKANDIHQGMTNNTISKDNNSNDNIDKILKKEKLIQQQKDALEKEAQEKLNKNEDQLLIISNIDVNAIDQTVKNELGNLYPEGVSEEIYERNDDNGLLISYVVRRVVVIGGEGNVYEKTSTKSGTSYTKNGTPISEYTWQDQTENATLTYH